MVGSAESPHPQAGDTKRDSHVFKIANSSVGKLQQLFVKQNYRYLAKLQCWHSGCEISSSAVTTPTYIAYMAPAGQRSTLRSYVKRHESRSAGMGKCYSDLMLVGELLAESCGIAQTIRTPLPEQSTQKQNKQETIMRGLCTAGAPHRSYV